MMIHRKEMRHWSCFSEDESDWNPSHTSEHMSICKELNYSVTFVHDVRFYGVDEYQNILLYNFLTHFMLIPKEKLPDHFKETLLFPVKKKMLIFV